jgi:hypothetical protein
LLVLDGGIHAAIFSVFLLVAAGALGMFRPRAHLLNAAALLAIGLVVSIKAVPVLLLSSGITPELDFTALGPSELARVLFNPFQRHLDVATTQAVSRFHEFGCYLSPLGLVLIGSQFREIRSRTSVRRWGALLLFFFWLASGAGGIFNPWHLIHRVPLLNLAHVQSRLFVLVALFFSLLVAVSLDRVRGSRALRVALGAFLVAEAIFVKSYPFDFGYRFEQPLPAVTLIPTTSIESVREGMIKPDLYFTGKYDYRRAYDHAAPVTDVLAESSPGYRGLAYVAAGEGDVKLESFTPGRLEFAYSSKGGLKAEFNTNYLGGWTSEPIGSVSSTPKGLVAVDLPSGDGHATLVYRPGYLNYVLAAYLLGALLWLGLLAFHLRGRST